MDNSISNLIHFSEMMDTYKILFIATVILFLIGISFLGIAIYKRNKIVNKKKRKTLLVLIMWDIFALFAFMCLLVYLYATYSDYKKEIEYIKMEIEANNKNQAKEEALSALKKKIVKKVFLGYELGGNFNDAIKLTQKLHKENTIYGIRILDGSIELSTNLLLSPDGENNKVACKLCSFNNKITSLLIVFEDLPQFTEVLDLYKKKYGDIYTEEVLPDNQNCDWTFSNSKIRLSKFTHTKRDSKIQVKKGREGLSVDNLQNYEVVETSQTFLKGITVIYIDLEQEKIVNDFEEAEKDKHNIELKKVEKQKAQQDSLKKSIQQKKYENQQI